MVPSAAVAMVSATVTGAFQCLQTQAFFYLVVSAAKPFGIFVYNVWLKQLDIDRSSYLKRRKLSRHVIHQ